jgi:sugar phosphate isomerase/epimerase
MANAFPKLHNAAWPGLVGKGGKEHGAESVISQDHMMELTARAEVNGVKFDGMDLFLSLPHVDIDSTDDDLKVLADKFAKKNLAIGSLVAPVWGGGGAFGSTEDRKHYLLAVEKACRIGKKLREIGIRSYGSIRIDTANSPSNFDKDPVGNQRKNIETVREAAKIADGFGEKLALEGEICWGGMHGWRTLLELLEGVNLPKTVGIQADMAHTLLFMLGYNAPGDALVPEGFQWEKATYDAGYRKLTQMLRPWVRDFHVAQNDATVFGSGSHDKTGRHCLADDKNGKLDIPYHAGFWLRDESGKHIDIAHMCWDGCMFPNAVMEQESTWNNVLAAMAQVREKHGWN